MLRAGYAAAESLGGRHGRKKRHGADRFAGKILWRRQRAGACSQGRVAKYSRGSLYTFLGPSGCGKTTTLRCVAGLERPDGGKISIGGQTVFASGERVYVPTNKRPIGMVFQSYAIWPHMTVAENVAYPLTIQRRPKDEIKRRVGDVLKIVGLDGLEDRPAPKLSGGQQQRVAFARALVNEPKVMLLDEPLSNLDAKLRVQMRSEIKALQRRTNITTIFRHP